MCARVSQTISTGNLRQTPKKVCKSSATASLKCCRLCKSFGDISFWTNIYSKGNRAPLAAAAVDIFGRPLRKDKLMPHLLCRPCERRLKSEFLNFEIERVKRCTEISPSVPRTLTKSAMESDSRGRRGLSFDAIPGQLQSSAEKAVNIFFTAFNIDNVLLDMFYVFFFFFYAVPGGGGASFCRF